MISDIFIPNGHNKTSLLLVMTVLMLRKNVKLDVIGMRSCVASLLRQVLGSGNSRSESYQMFSSVLK